MSPFQKNVSNFLAASGAIISLSIAGFSAHGATETSPTAQRAHLSHDGINYDFLIYSNFNLAADFSKVERIIVLQHGVRRTGDITYAVGMTLLAASGVDASKILILAPQFSAPEDTLVGKHNIPLWNSDGLSNWAAGAMSVDRKYQMNSMQVYDDLLRQFRDRSRFPILKRVTFAGHSAGAQFVHRYAVLNNDDESTRAYGIDVRYIVANPSSYLYFTNERAAGDSFLPFSYSVCPEFNDYKYGMQNMVSYGVGYSGMDLFGRHSARQVTYMLGTADNDPNHPELDTRCAAEAQGPNRLERGRAYVSYERYLANQAMIPMHRAYEVIDVDHSQSQMFGSQCGIQELFETTVTSGASCVDTSLSSTASVLTSPFAAGIK